MTAASGRDTVAVVTGATGTVGAALVAAFVEHSVPTIAVGRDPGRLAALRQGHRPSTVETHRCDVADPAAVADLAARLAAARCGRRTIFVHAAGMHGPLGPVARLDPTVWPQVMQVNLFAAIALTRALLPDMLATGWGRIVNVSSAAGLDVSAFNGPYALSKAALNRWTAQVALEVAGSGVTAHALHPGEIASTMSRQIADRAATDDRFRSFAVWARAAEDAGDDPRAAAGLVLGLLDDDVAARCHGAFLFPPAHRRPPLRLLP